jgi:SPP1 gp7 family putative phage head morphogenesis protein
VPSRNPIVSGNIKDRTGAAGILRRAGAEIRKRWAGLQLEVLAAFDRIPTYALNEAEVLYGLTPQQMEALSLELRAALERWIANERDPAHVAWWGGYVKEASQLGAAQSVANLTQLSEVYAASRALEQVIYSTPYKNRLAMAQIKSMDHWTGLSATLRGELSQIIGRAVVDGKNPKAVRTEIAERLGVSKAKALQYAQTDITDTLRQARIAESEYAMEELGIGIGLLWTSALIPTTRSWHASRNGKVYTQDEVRSFYASGGNRYNCRCAVTEALLDDEGKPILTKRLQSAMANERKAWQSVHDQS